MKITLEERMAMGGLQGETRQASKFAVTNFLKLHCFQFKSALLRDRCF